MVLVPGVGEEAPTETSRAVADGLIAHSDGYARGDADAIDVVVPTGGDRPKALYRADRLSLRRGDAEIDLVEMRWSDISRFPRGLIPFFTSLFGLGLQLMTVGLEATHHATGRGRWPWAAVAAGAALAGGLAGIVADQLAGDPAAGVLVGGAVAGLVLLAALILYRRGPMAIANALIEAASWWVAAVVVPLTVIAALLATALWLVVDDVGGLDDTLAAVLVALVGALALWRLGKGIADGGWKYGGKGWYIALNPLLVTGLLFAAATVVGVAMILATDSVAAGLSRAGLIAGPFGLRAAWLVAVTLIAAALTALIVVAARGGGPRLQSLWFTAVTTTALSTLVVALVGAILIGGVGAVAYSTATEASWGEGVDDVRCLAEVTSWSWSRDCGRLGPAWGPLADDIATDLRLADRAQAGLAGRRSAALDELAETERADALEAVARDQATIDLVRDQAATAQRAAQASPTWWAQDAYSVVTRPLAWMVAVLLGLALVGGLALALHAGARSLLARRRGEPIPRGRTLTAILRDAPGWRGGALLLALGLLATTWTWATWTLVSEDSSGVPGGSAVGAAITSAGLLALLALARFLPVDPRRWRSDVGGGLERLRAQVDRAYDVATYLRIDEAEGAGVRTRIIRRFRALLRRLEDDYDEIVILAHSQGTMLTIATLFGDARRRDAEAAGDDRGVRPWSAAVGESRLTTTLRGVMTFGSPFRQTYEARLPGQYDWLDPAGSPDLRERLRPFSFTWVNAYRARDFIGRAIFQEPLDPATAVEGEGRAWTLPADPSRIRLVDVCLRGPGSHMGYWNDRELIAWLHAMLRAPEPRDPRGYAIEVARGGLSP